MAERSVKPGPVPVPGPGQAEPPRVDRTIELDDEPARAAPAPGGSFAVGATVGHFVVRRLIGEGGMGLVLEAYDADLDRTVAIKVVRDRSSGSAAGRRLLREAQAMARLSHPNVVGIHEVGTVDGQVFLVMEYVTGKTMADWLAAGADGSGRVRPWREVVGVLIQAGEGLLAAHRAGLVHRDFKPSNVLIEDWRGHGPRGDHGRVRVTDFGIARLAADVIGDAMSRSALAVETTRAGARIGTPGYMAPEQSRGEAVDARADQYAFGVTLREALEGQPGTAVPARVRRAIARATSEQAAARFPSLAELLAELRRAAGGRRRKVIAAIAIAGGLVAGGLVAGVTLVDRDAGADDSEACARGAALIDQVWNPDARVNLASAFAASGRNHAAATTVTVTGLLDDYAGAWRLGRAAACQGDAEARPRRVACLDRRLGALRAQVAVWRGASGDAAASIVDRAVRGAAALPSIEECADTHATPPGAAVAPLMARIDEVEALERSGEIPEAVARMPALLAEVEAADDPASLAIALALAGRVAHADARASDARAFMTRAALASARAGDDRGMANALLRQAAATVAEGKPGDAIGLVDAAGALVLRAKLPDFEPFVALRRGDALERAGRTDEAIVELTRAVEMFDAIASRGPTERLWLVGAKGMLATAYIGAGRYADALPLLEQGLAIEEELLGAEHPDLGESLHDIAVIEVHLGRREEAKLHLERARTILEGAHGPGHYVTGVIELTLGSLAYWDDQPAEALAHYAKAQPIMERFLQPDHPDLATLFTNIASADVELGRVADAIPAYERAIGMYERSGVAGRRLATPLIGLGSCLYELERPKDALVPLERAYRELQSEDLPPRELVEVRFNLAAALWDLGERAAAVEHARAALLAAPTDDAELQPLREHITGWFVEKKVELP